MKEELPHSFYDKVFTYEDTQLTRRDLESFACPFCAENVTDELMMKIAVTMNTELKKWHFDTGSDRKSEELEFTYGEARLYEMDNAAAAIGVPHLEDPPLKVR